VIVTLVAVLTLLPYLEQREIENLVAQLTSGDEARIAASLADFQALDETAYRTILPTVHEPLLAYFESRVASLVDEAQGRYDYSGAFALLDEANDLMVDPRFAELENELQLRRTTLIGDLNAQIDQLLNSGRLLPNPEGADVVDALEVLDQVDPDDELLSGVRLPTAYADAGAAAIDDGDLDLAKQLIDFALSRFDNDHLNEISARLAAALQVRSTAASKPRTAATASTAPAGAAGSSGPDVSVADANREAEMARAAAAALRDGDFAVAERYARDGLQHSPDNPETELLLGEIAAAAYDGHCTADLAGRGAAANPEGACWDMLTAAIRGPTLVVVPIGADFDQPFGIGLSEASVGDWNQYCNLSGQCEPRSDVADDLPLSNVSVDEVRDYATWLSERTGSTYRLPTLSEWQYAANQPHGNRRDNCRGEAPRSVTAGSTNAWGLSDYLGNVREMVTEGPGVVYRGGSYADTLCSVNLGSNAGDPDLLTGFRLLRELANTQ